ncbi:UNVERIFIED_CONTAM: hypothetical protein H355_004413 [Colinus virginianus]|nr:hypothetical protein H355_004413 [Colinus virginianus]
MAAERLFNRELCVQVRGRGCEERRLNVRVNIELLSAANPVHKKEDKTTLEEKLRKTEEDFTRQLSFTQQSLSEKSRELDKLKSEWASYTASLTSKHTQELTAEKERALQAQTQYQQQHEQQKKELESLHQRSVQQLQNRLSELEVINKDLTERRYKGDSTVRELKAKLSGVEDECQRAKQEVVALRRENTALDAECHEKEKLINQLQTRVAVLEQEIKDKDQLVLRTKEVLDATQEQKVILEENTEKKLSHIEKLETTIKSLSAELLKANEIIKKLQGDLKTLMSKLKLKNTVTIQQEKLLAEKEERLQKGQRELQEAGQALRLKEQETDLWETITRLRANRDGAVGVCKLQERLETTTQKLEESKQLLKTNENVITWLNKQLNEVQMVKKMETPSSAHGGVRSTLSPHSVLDRPSFPGSGISHPISPFYAFQKLAEPARNKNGSAHCALPKIHFNSQVSKMDQHSDVQAVTAAPGHPANKENGENVGLDSKYFKKKEDSIPLRGLSQNTLNSEYLKPFLSKVQPSPPAAVSTASAYFPG